MHLILNCNVVVFQLQYIRGGRRGRDRGVNGPEAGAAEQGKGMRRGVVQSPAHLYISESSQV